MAERSILFTGPMVRAILDGRKTQTRRVLHIQPPEWVNFCEQPQMFNVLHQWVPSGLWRWAELDENQHRALRQWPIDEEGSHYWLRPRFSVGDRLYVRETWQALSFGDYLPTKDRVCDLRFAATDPLADAAKGVRGYSWRPGIHMPRWASRLTLIVTDVRVERLQDISEADAKAEGCPCQSDDDLAGMDAWGWFRDLWDGINAKRGFGWDANPWVVALTFETVRSNIDAVPSKATA